MVHAAGPADFGHLLLDENRTISGLLGHALQLFEGDYASARQLVEQAFMLADQTTRPSPVTSGGLASWQAQRVEAYIDRNLAHVTRIETVANLVSLSPSHFSRAFKVTFGITYSRYMIRRRIALAKQMLLTTDTPIAQIAIECGLSDQSHLTRLFTSIVGSPPNAWRRAARCDTRNPVMPSRLDAYEAPAQSHGHRVGPVVYA